MKVNKVKDKKNPIANEKTPWFSTSELLEYLGISKSELDNKFQLLSEGIHYKRTKSKQPNNAILWRIDLIDELLCLPIAPLEKEAMLKAINNEITCNKSTF